MKNNRIISIDSSTKKSAYAVFDDENYTMSELIVCNEKDMDERFKNMSLNLLNILSNQKPNVV